MTKLPTLKRLAKDAEWNALKLIEAGCYVFPVGLRFGHDKPTGGVKAVKFYHKGLLWGTDATNDPGRALELFADYPDSFVGIATGPSRLVVVDLDLDEGVDGRASLKAAKLKTPKTHAYPTLGGGEHLLYAAPEGRNIKTMGPLVTPDGVKLDGVDIRADGGMLVYYGPRIETLPSFAPAPAWTLNESATKATDRGVNVEIDQWMAAQRPGKPSDTVKAARDSITAHDTSHDTMLDATRIMVEKGSKGQPGVAKALEKARAVYVGNYPAFGKKWDDAVLGSIRKWGLPPVTFDAPPPKKVEAGVAPKGELAELRGVDDSKARGIEDNPLAIELAELLRPEWAMTEALGLLRWSGKVWKRAQMTALVERCRRQLRLIEAAEHAKAMSWKDEKMAAKRLDKLPVLLSARKARDVAALVAGILAEDGLVPDSHPDLLNTQSGIVDLVTSELMPHDSKYVMTKITEAAYEPGATSEDWATALKAMPKGVRSWFQVRMGQAITGYMVPDDRLVILAGGGGNGKSTIVEAMRTSIGDGYAVTAPERVLMSNPGDHPTELTTLMGARAAFIEELPEGRTLNVKRLKDALGTPKMTARRMREDSISWQATHTPLLTTNYLPIVQETDAGTWRRFAYVRLPWRYVEAGEELQKGDRVGDPGLRHRLGSPSPAVLAWLVEGARRWYAEGMPRLPEIVRQDTAAWRAEADPIMAFVSEQLVLDAGFAIPSSEMATEFNAWCRGRGHNEWSDQTINARLGSHETFATVERKAVRFGAKLQPSRRGMSVAPLPPGTRAWVGVRFRVPFTDTTNGFEAFTDLETEGVS